MGYQEMIEKDLCGARGIRICIKLHGLHQCFEDTVLLPVGFHWLEDGGQLVPFVRYEKRIKLGGSVV